MKILYVAYKHDPTLPNLGSSKDYEFYKLINSICDEIFIFKPYRITTNIFWPRIKRLYRKITGKILLKYSFFDPLILSIQLNRFLKNNHFDAIFTIYPTSMCFYKNDTPLIISLDTTFIGQQSFWELYGNFGMKVSVWQEKRTFNHAKKIITQSEWSKRVLKEKYGINSEKVVCFPMPAAIPEKYGLNFKDYVPISEPLKLLLVAREYYRKGVDIAIDIVKNLNKSGIASELTICGLSGLNKPYVKFVGPYDKSVESQLLEYIGLYKSSHLLIHPARFEAAGITPSEAAAFGTPTITNNVGGLATTVEDGISGYVLPMQSDSIVYVKKIIFLIENPKIYLKLCKTTRLRYEKMLKWSSNKKKIKREIKNAIESE